MREHVTVGIRAREDVPVERLGEPSYLRVATSQQLVDEVSRGRVADPLARVNTRLDEDARPDIAAETQVHTLDRAALIRATALDRAHVARVALGQRVHPRIDLVESVEAGPAKTTVLLRLSLFKCACSCAGMVLMRLCAFDIL